MRLFALATLIPLAAAVPNGHGRGKCGPRRSTVGSQTGFSTRTVTIGSPAGPSNATATGEVLAPSETVVSVTLTPGAADTVTPIGVPLESPKPSESPEPSANETTNSSASDSRPGVQPTASPSASDATPTGPNPPATTAGGGSGVFFDNSLSVQKRRAALANMTQDDVFAIVGQPKLIGDAQYHPKIREGLYNLTMASVMHAQEVQSVIGWDIPFLCVTDEAASTYHDEGIRFLYEMIESWSEGTMGHEMAHGIWSKMNLGDGVEAEVKAAGLDDRAKYGDIPMLINEAFAMSYGDRAATYLHPENYYASKIARFTQDTLGLELNLTLTRDGFHGAGYYDSLGLTQATVDAGAKIIEIADRVVWAPVKAKFDAIAKVDPEPGMDQ